MNRKKFLKRIILAAIGALMLTMAGCTGSNQEGAGIDSEGEKKVVVASKPHTEQLILGEIISILIEENTDIEVERKFAIAGGTSNLHPALLSGEIDMYPEYTGTGWLFVLKNDLVSDPQELYQKTKEQYTVYGEIQCGMDGNVRFQQYICDCTAW